MRIVVGKLFIYCYVYLIIKKIKSFLFFLGNICLNVIDCEMELEVDFEWVNVGIYIV